jgi:hypothetical protein
VERGVRAGSERGARDDIGVDHRDRPGVFGAANGVKQERRRHVVDHKAEMAVGRPAHGELGLEIVARGHAGQCLHRADRIVGGHAAQILKRA